MDILSLSKANKAHRQVKDLDENLIAKKAESRFQTVDARLDWIEAQASVLRKETVLPIDLAQGTFTNTEPVDGKIQLKKINATQYSPSGTWESLALDLGESYEKTILAEIVKQVKTGTTCEIEVATSTDGKTFSSYSEVNVINPPQTRFIKIKATLSAVPGVAETKVYELDNAIDNEHQLIVTDKVIANGDLSLKTDYSYTGIESIQGETKIIRTLIPKTNFKRINSIEVI